jgi:hypothetical protein
MSNCQRLTCSQDIIKRKSNFRGGGEKRGYSVPKMYDKKNDERNIMKGIFYNNEFTFITVPYFFFPI